MKQIIHFKLAIACLLLPLAVLANNADRKGKHTKEKTIHQEFNVNSDATVRIDNSYGNLDIITWDENRVVIDVTITTNGNDEDKVAEKLDGIDVEFSNSPNSVSARTRFKKSKSWWNWGRNNVSMKVNYVIKMPASNHVDLSNDYGSINLDTLKGNATISCDYGSITTKELLGAKNDLNFDYTKNCYFEYIENGTINADYSGYTVGKAKNLALSADYTKSKIEIVEDIAYNNDYGSLTIEKANNVAGDGNYLTVRLGSIYKNVTIDGDYGSLKIDTMGPNAGSVRIDSDYMKITLGFDAAYNFDFDINLEYASLRGDTEALEFNKKVIKSSDKYYQGYHGREHSGNAISISSDYGSVTLNKN